MPGTDAMRAADRRRQSRSRLLSGRELTLAISAAAWLAAPTGARAFGVPGTDYVLSNVSADFGGTRESISGIFTITANAGLEWYAKFNGALCGACLNGNIVHAIGITGNTIVTDAYQITFSSDFSSVIGIRSWTGDIGTNVTGGAVGRFPSGIHLCRRLRRIWRHHRDDHRTLWLRSADPGRVRRQHRFHGRRSIRRQLFLRRRAVGPRQLYQGRGTRRFSQYRLCEQPFVG